MTKTVLFLCTGNYYRSRFAEHLFNHLASARCPNWAAISRGLALERGANNLGPISLSAEAELTRLGVELSVHRSPIPLQSSDLDEADHVVAMSDREHRPLLQERFASWTSAHIDPVEFWDVDDIDFLDPEHALRLVAENVAKLCSQREMTCPGT